MTESNSNPQAAGGVLLATDLSARCDRALDRASFLARQWNVPLLALHVLEPAAAPSRAEVLPSWRRPPDPARVAERRLRADMAEGGCPAEALVQEGDPVECILRTAQARACSLIVIGVSRNEALGRNTTGATVDKLVRQSPVPVLVVRRRVRGPYRDIVLATDFSAPSRQAANAAMRLFPGAQMTLFHAYDAPFASYSADAQRYREDYREVASADAAAFLETLDMPRGERGRMRMMIESGPPPELLREYVDQAEAEIVVLGTHGRSGVMNLLIGSIATRIIAEVDCDTLTVRAS